MNNRNIKKVISKFPDSPGVYIFLGSPKRSGGGKSKSEILYIGKATSLRDRVRTYMSRTVLDTRSPLIAKMLEEFEDIEYIKTDSVLEALVLEANLIKKHQPEANIKEKDNKSFNFVVITKEDFPRVLVIRGRELLQSRIMSRTPLAKNSKMAKGVFDIKNQFGPFPNGGQLKEALKIIRKMFPYRDKCNSAEVRLPQKTYSGKRPSGNDGSTEANRPNVACFNRQIGLCPGVCTGEITKEDYQKQIQNIILFFRGNKKRLLKNLEKQMRGFAKNREFEKAGEAKKTIFLLKHIQDISLIKEDCKGSTLKNGAQGRTLDSETFRIESYDVAHMSGQNVVGVMIVVEDGEVKKSDYRKFKIKNNPSVNDTKALTEVLSRRLAHIEWRFPDLIVVDGGTAQKRVMEKILRENKVNIPVVSVVKDERHKPKNILGDRQWLKYEREIILANSESHRFAIGYHRKLRGKFG
ncbi:MAG TPA: GIY-YIG nuclease family protein [Candidatus Paceibacterota bacterium]